MIMRRKRKTKMTRWLCAAILGSALCGGALAQTTAVKVDSETISGLGARNIGSAAMSGRVAALDAVQGGGRVEGLIGAGRRRGWVDLGHGRTNIQAGLRQTTCPIHRRGHD